MGWAKQAMNWWNRQKRNFPAVLVAVLFAAILIFLLLSFLAPLIGSYYCAAYFC